MTDTRDAGANTTLVPGAHRVIRTLEADEGPFEGVLVTDGADVVVRSDSTELSGWLGWGFAGSEHVAAPVDLVRRTDGHDVLLPWCTERVVGFLARRGAAGEPLSAGECVTLLVSLLRALSELGSDARDGEPRGTWWLTDDGRPVLVVGEGDEARAGVARLITSLIATNEDRPLGRLLVAMQAGVQTSIEQQPRVSPLLLERWEGEMLAIAAPRPLRRAAAASTSMLPSSDVSGFARDASPSGVSRRGALVPDLSERGSPAAVRRSTTTRSAARRRPMVGRTGGRRAGRIAGWSAAPGIGRSAVGAVVGGLHGRLRRGERTSRVGARTAEVARRRGRTPGGRRRSILVASGSAAAVLIVGALWPGDGGEGASGASESSTPAIERRDAPASGPSEDLRETASAAPEKEVSAPESSVPVDSVEAAASLWRELEGCSENGDEECRAAVAPDSAVVRGDLVFAGTGEPSFTLLDEYGDIAVVRLEGSAGVSSKASEAEGETADGELPDGKVVVLVRINEKWLVRDIYDVADQPK